METVTNAATTAVNAASRMVFGDSSVSSNAVSSDTTTNPAANETGGQEPISGEQGKGTVSEPFDKGNTDLTSTSTEPSSTTGIPSHPKPSMNTDNAAAGGAIRPEHETDKTGVTGDMSSDPKATDIKPSESAGNPGAAPESAAAPKAKHQGADKPMKGPEGEEVSAVTGKKDEAEDALQKRDPNDHSGEPMKMHTESEAPESEGDRQESKAGQEGGGEHGAEPKGTGEEWVKTSGLKADGGDFDATKPGAGREADRLLEQKGIHKEAPGKPSEPEPSSSESPDTKEKVSMGDKIKNKLHIGHKDKS